MSDKQIEEQLKTLKAATKEALRSKESARKFLQAAGIIKAAPATAASKKGKKK